MLTSSTEVASQVPTSVSAGGVVSLLPHDEVKVTATRAIRTILLHIRASFPLLDLPRGRARA
jgi:hypothetical protein